MPKGLQGRVLPGAPKQMRDSSVVEQESYKLLVISSNLIPATNKDKWRNGSRKSLLNSRSNGRVGSSPTLSANLWGVPLRQRTSLEN